MNMKIVFVVLHYLAIEETLNCVSSIQNNIIYDNYVIIVVDNGSGIVDDTKQLRILAEKDDKIEFVELKKNLGFAQGNNVGFELAKKKYNADFIVLLNNDIIIEQTDFCDIICNKYNEYHFAVLGPKVFLKDGTYFSNPIQPGRYLAYRQRIAQILIIFKYLGTFFGDLDIRKKNITDVDIKAKCEDFYNKESVGCKLHGCCLIFSREYINKFDGLNPHTFLYLEEDILFVRLRNNGLVSLYSPDLWLTHLEDAATNKVVQTERKKRRFIYKNHIKSYSALIDEIKNKNS